MSTGVLALRLRAILVSVSPLETVTVPPLGADAAGGALAAATGEASEEAGA
jgi:hypothetical protein